MKNTAKLLASKGRHGDTELVHMSRAEVDALNQGLGALTGRTMTVNPETGLPEAFNWASLIPAVVGIGATVLSGGTLSPLTAGLISGATTTAVTGDWKQGLASGITAGALSGVGSGISEMAGSGAAGAGSAAGSAGMSAANGMAGGMAGGAADALGSAGMQSAVTSAVPDATAGLAMEAGANGVSQAALDATANSAMQSGIGSLGAQAGTDAAAQGMANMATNTATNTAATGAGGAGGATLEQAFGGKNLYTRTLPGLMAGANVVSNAMAPGPMKYDTQEDDEAPTTYRTMHRKYHPADPRYTLGGGEPQMFDAPTYTTHHFAQGGLASLNGDVDMVQTKRARQLRARYRSRKDVIDDLRRPDSVAKELGVTGPDDPILDIAFGFTAKQGRKNPSISPAFAGGGHVQGMGDGMSDEVPAAIEGQQPAQLSNDEYVVPADAVSDLGNGSSKAGAQQLDGMVARIRRLRHGTPQQPPQVDPQKAMPA